MTINHPQWLSIVVFGLLTLSAQAQGEVEKDLKELVPSLASPDIKTRCQAQVEFDQILQELDASKLRAILVELFKSSDPETTQRLERSLEEAFVAENYVEELGYLGISIDTGFFKRDGQNVLVVKAARVSAGSPAAKEGLEAEDLIVAIDGQKIEGADCEQRLRKLIASKGAGATCHFMIRRGEAVLPKKIVLASRVKDLPAGMIDDLRKPTKSEKRLAFKKWLGEKELDYLDTAKTGANFEPSLSADVQQMFRIEQPWRR